MCCGPAGAVVLEWHPACPPPPAVSSRLVRPPGSLELFCSVVLWVCVKLNDINICVLFALAVCVVHLHTHGMCVRVRINTPRTPAYSYTIHETHVEGPGLVQQQSPPCPAPARRPRPLGPQRRLWAVVPSTARGDKVLPAGGSGGRGRDRRPWSRSRKSGATARGPP